MRRSTAAAADSNGAASSAPMKRAFLIYNPVAGQVSNVFNISNYSSTQHPMSLVRRPLSTCPAFGHTSASATVSCVLLACTHPAYLPSMNKLYLAGEPSNDFR
jgi:hypothetical protein